MGTFLAGVLAEGLLLETVYMAVLIVVLSEGLLVVSAGGMFLGGVLADGRVLGTVRGIFLVVEVALTGTPVMALPTSSLSPSSSLSSSSLLSTSTRSGRG